MNTRERGKNDLMLHTGYGFVSSSTRPAGIFSKMSISLFAAAAFLALLLIHAIFPESFFSVLGKPGSRTDYQSRCLNRL